MNDSSANQRRESKRSSGYSLGYLFLLVTLAAVISGQIGPLLGMLNASSGDLAPLEPYVLAILCGFSGAGLGFIVGIQHYRRMRGILLGLFLGLVFGAFAGLIIYASLANPQLTLLLSSAAGVVLLGLAAWVRGMQDDDPVTHKDVYRALLRKWQLDSPPEKTTSPKA